MANVIGSQDLGQDTLSKNTPGQPSTVSGQAGSGNAPQSQAASNPNQTKGSGYTNIQRVLQANAGNQLGQTIGSNIQSAGNTAQNNLKNAQQQFQSDTSQNQANNQGNQQFIQGELNQYGGSGVQPSQGQNDTTGQPTAQANLAQPVNAPSQADISRFQSLASGQYQGPTNLNNAQQLQGQAQNVNQMGQALGTAGGRIGLLNQIVGKPQYTTGQQNLDNLLLGQSNDPSLQAAKRQALTLQKQVGNAVTGAQAQGQQQTAQAQTFGQDVQNQLGQNVQSQYSNLQNQTQQAQAAKDKQYNDLVTAVQSGQMTQDQANLLGLTQGENTFGVLNDANKYLTKDPTQANVSNVANSQDYARMQALQQLAGQYAPQAAQQAFGQFQNPSQAGQFAQQPIATGDTSGLQRDISNTQQNFLQQLNAITPGGLNAGSIGANNGILNNLTKGNNGLAGLATGAVTGSLGAGALGSLGSQLTGGGDASAQAREAAKQQGATTLKNYYDKLKELAPQFGMNMGRFQNWSPQQLQSWLDPQNVGANYNSMVNELSGALTANNGINIVPSSAYPALAQAQQPPDLGLENMPKVT